MKKLVILLLALSFFLLLPGKALAIVNPLEYPNNRFGIHIFDENDLPDAQNLINSSGGDWGYVTLVIRQDERDLERWQKVFNQMRRRHLIPIVRLATSQKGSGWEKFNSAEVENWVYFLNSLNWVVKNRYLIIGNEPNHADEWGGEISPEEYASILCQYSQKLKLASEDFFILQAGLDASAPSDKQHLSEAEFIKGELQAENIFNCFDGWASHSYPNPGFFGSEYASGQGSLRTYQWEIAYLKSLGLKKELPVFITETGWSNNLAGNKIKYAFENVWTDKNIVAITPFILNYTQAPFAQFSWKKEDGSFYPFYQEVKSLPKEKGRPQQERKGRIKFAFVPKVSISGTTIFGALLVANQGQSIWDSQTEIAIALENQAVIYQPISKETEPEKNELLTFRFQVPEGNQNIRGKVYLSQDGERLSEEHNFEIFILRPVSQQENLLSRCKNLVEAWILKKGQK